MNPIIDDIIPKLPDTEDSRPLLSDIRQVLKKLKYTVVVLDDDPTGTQTVHDIPVLTSWTDEAIGKEFEAQTPLFYILTNSRSLQQGPAIQLAGQIGKVLKAAGEKFQRKFCVISRSDSTLRGHYPHEVDALERGLGKGQLLKIVIPAFFEGNRFTIGDIHYILEGKNLIPVSETAYAKDKTFGYENSNLKKWIAEKTEGRVKAEDVYAFSLENLRSGGAAFAAKQLKDLSSSNTCIVNATSQHHLDIFALGLLKSEMPFLGRTAASFVASIGAVGKKPLLSQLDINPHRGKGSLWIAGSYVPKTTSQLANLLDKTAIQPFEIDVTKILDNRQRGIVIRNAVSQINTCLARGKDIIIYTSRKLIAAENKEASLSIGNRVSDALTSIASGVVERPAYILAKGGITSSDVATKSLKIKKARVLGQIIPGVPVWELGDEARFPGMAYIVYPGNVGDSEALTNIYHQLSHNKHE